MTPPVALDHDVSVMWQLREAIVSSPPSIALHRARVFTDVFQETEGDPWVVRKAKAMREYFRTVPLYIRDHDRIAGTLTETPGAAPVNVELGIAENRGYTAERPYREGYLKGEVPRDILDYWEGRNLWGRVRAYQHSVEGITPERDQGTWYKFLSNQGHLSPGYSEVLAIGLDGLLNKIKKRLASELFAGKRAFLFAARESITGLIEWIERYSVFLAEESGRTQDAARAEDLRAMAEVAANIAHQPPKTFREALQLIWFCQQAIHVEGHGYSNTPDRVDQILYPYYLADKEAGRIDDDETLQLCENLLLKIRDNTVWTVEHNLTQGICVSGSTMDGQDMTNELSWMFIQAVDNVAVPEPLIWVRWHPNIDQDFFDFCIKNLAGNTCFPLMMSDSVVPAMFQGLGVSKEDSFEYVPAGCNEIAIPGKAYYNPAGFVNGLTAVERALTGGARFPGWDPVKNVAPSPDELDTFERFTDAVQAYMREELLRTHKVEMANLYGQMNWGQTPLTSCFFEGCIEDGHDMTAGTKYNTLCIGSGFVANFIDAMAAIREVVYEKGEATLAEIAKACADNFEGHETLRAKLVRAPKHGNDLPELQDLVAEIERLYDEVIDEIARDPRDGSKLGHSQVTRDGGVRAGQYTGATPDGRLAGTPLASSVTAAQGMEKSGPTAALNSILMLHPSRSWRSGYNANLRFQTEALRNPETRAKVRAMLNSFFTRGGQEMQINAVDTDVLRKAQETPEQYGNVVVRIAGYSALFVNLDRDTQEAIIARTEHGA